MNELDPYMQAPYIHPTAVIDSGATIGAGTYVWHFCHVMPLAIIGSGCKLGQNVFIDNNVKIGNGVKIQNNVSIYNGVNIEEDVFIGPSVVFTNVINPRSFIERKNEFKPTLIKKGATIGANATIVCGITIGEYALIGAGTVVTKDVAAYAMVVGNPARQLGWVSEAGIKLVFDIEGKAFCSVHSQAYTLVDNKVHIV